MLIDLLQCVRVPLLLYYIPRCADSYSSSSSSSSIYYLLYVPSIPRYINHGHDSICWSAFRCLYCVAGYQWWCSILALSSVAVLRTPARHGLAYQQHLQQRQHVLYQDHWQPHVDYRSAICCCVVVCVSQLPLPLPLSDRVPVVVAVVFRLYLNDRLCWWRGVACWSAIPFCDGHVVACVSQLSLPLSDRVPVVVVAAAAVVFWLHLEERTSWWSWSW